MPLIETKGAASAQGFGEFAQQTAANYIEDVFSTWLYTGNGSTQTITNGIDLAGKGGMVWWKRRDSDFSHGVADTNRGTNKYIRTDTTDAEGTYPYLNSFNTNGYTLSSGDQSSNAGGGTYASWTFRKQPKFFDVVTYTGDGTSGRSLPHSLGSVPGCVIIKRTSNTSDWLVWHRSLSGTYPSSVNYLRLNLTSAQDTASQPFTQAPSSTDLTLSASVAANGNGSTYVAYIFAHNAGGFGLTGTDNVISCGSWTDSGSGTQTITLGYEPQFVIYKRIDASSNWVMLDNMRGWPVINAADSTANLYPNLSNAESGGNYGGNGPTATGFNMPTLGGGTYIYIAIRRGPMKTPTTGTSVFSPVARTGTGAAASVTAGFAPDIGISAYRTAGEYMPVVDKLRGPVNWLTWQQSITSAASNSYSGEWFTAFTNTGVTVGADNSGGKSVNSSGGSLIQYYFQRAPGFCDVVCYTGTGSNTTQTHNLGVAPELLIIKGRNGTFGWATYAAPLGIANYVALNSANASAADPGNVLWNNTAPTSTVFSVGTNATVNNSGGTYVAYLFASCPGVSKVGSYTGTGALQTINCGFTGGARFVLIKRTDSTGGWYIYDSARGISSGNDPYLLINATAAEVTGTNYVDTTSVGFQVTAAAPAELNANGGTYLFLAIA